MTDPFRNPFHPAPFLIIGPNEGTVFENKRYVRFATDSYHIYDMSGNYLETCYGTSTIQDLDVYVLTEAQYNQFMQVMSEDREPTPKMKAAMERYKRLVISR